MKNKYFILVAVTSFVLLSAGCGSKNQELIRPELEGQSNNIEGNRVAGLTEYEKNLDKVYNTPLQVGNSNLLVQVVSDDASRQLGLSGRTRLMKDSGMLFDFTNTQNTRPSFWMKDMKFPIDIIWINNNKITGIETAVPIPDPNTADYQLATYSPPTTITHVLEVEAGWSAQNKIKVGDTIKY